MSEEKQSGLDPTDPYMDLQPIFLGEIPEGDAWRVDDVFFVPKHSHRNAWEMYIENVCVVTFDADKFETTADLGAYVDGVIQNLNELAEAQTEDDPRRFDSDDRRSFQ